MARARIPIFAILFGAMLCTPVLAQGRPAAHLLEATYSSNDALSRSVAHIAVASTDLRRQDLSQADLLNLMIVLSLSKKHP